MDAQRCVEVKPSWAKGYSRMGTALFRLGKHDKAATAYSKGELVLFPAPARSTQQYSSGGTITRVSYGVIYYEGAGKLRSSSLRFIRSNTVYGIARARSLVYRMVAPLYFRTLIEEGVGGPARLLHLIDLSTCDKLWTLFFLSYRTTAVSGEARVTLD